MSKKRTKRKPEDRIIPSRYGMLPPNVKVTREQLIEHLISQGYHRDTAERFVQFIREE